MENTKNITAELFLSDARGVYIPRDFAQSIDLNKIPKKYHDDLEFLANAEPTTDGYWDTWQSILDNFQITPQEYPNENWSLYQDGDLWLIRSKKHTHPDEWDEFWEFWD